jgi:hypothetical protein
MLLVLHPLTTRTLTAGRGIGQRALAEVGGNQFESELVDPHGRWRNE